MNILVTGANGQLAQCIKWIVDLNFNGKPDHYVGEKNYYIFKTKEELPIGDLAEVRKVIKEEFINVIINCAAYTDVNKAQEQRELAHLVNCIGAMNLAIAAKEVCAVLIHISTDYVFSDENRFNTPIPPHNFTYPEDNCGWTYFEANQDDNYYGFSKLGGEDAIIRSGCKYIIIRTSWLYSWFGKNFVKTMYRKIMNKEDIKVVYDQVGSPTSAHELAMFIHHIIEENNSNTRYLSKTGIYNFVGNGVASWYDIVEQIRLYLIEEHDCDLYEDKITPCLSSEFPQPVIRPSYSVLDNSLTQERFNFKISHWVESLIPVIDKLFDEEIYDENKNERLENTIKKAQKEFEKEIDEYKSTHKQ